MSKAHDIAMALQALVERIRLENGYQTNIGRLVLRGRKALDEDEHLPCTVIAEGNDSVQSDTITKVKIEQRYFLEAHDLCDPDNPNDKAHQIIADLKRAVFTSTRDRSTPLAGLALAVRYRGRTIGAREDGGNTVFAGIEVAVEYVEDLTNP